MEFLVLILLPAVCNILVSGASSPVISKKDFKELNIACYKEFSCRQSVNQQGFLASSSCECDETCFNRGTCCYDSYYRDLKPPSVMPSCKTLNEENRFHNIAYFTVDRCPYGGDTNPSWESLCKNEWSEGDDMIKLVPVISMHSFITYKNYFCFRCHELVDEFQFFRVLFESDSVFEVDIPNDIKLTYAKSNKSWMAPVGDKYNFVPVKVELEIPLHMYGLPKQCEPNLISQCSETWSYNDVSEKCNAYMAAVYIKRDGTFFKYKNPHCAVCNFETLDNLLCRSEYFIESTPDFSNLDSQDSRKFDETNVTSYLEWYEEIHRSAPKHHSIDINAYEEKEKRQLCDGNFLWDPFERECKNDICALPIYMLERGECILS